MGVIRVNYHDIEKIRQGFCLGRGKEGSCYFQSKYNCIFKIYHSFFRQNKLYFDNLTDDRISFPKDILLYGDTDLIIGYTMPYLRGVDLVNGFPWKLDLNLLKNAYVELKNLILKYKDIYMDDMCLDNIFYDDRKASFSLIDTSRWYPKDNCYKENLSEINWVLITSLLVNMDVRNNSISNDKLFSELYRIYYQYSLETTKKINGMKYNNINLDGMFIKFLDLVEEQTSELKGYKVKKIEDLMVK